MKMHLIKPVSYPHVLEPVYCGYFCSPSICTKHTREATCKSCIRAHAAAVKRYYKRLTG